MQTTADALASRILARGGVRAIWSIHTAAAAAYRAGKIEAAESLIQIAESAEREWTQRAEHQADRI
jgi:hypothetical protein